MLQAGHSNTAQPQSNMTTHAAANGPVPTNAQRKPKANKKATATAAAAAAAGAPPPSQDIVPEAPNELALALDRESFHAHLVATHRDICQHLYHQGFLNGLMADLTVKAVHHSYRLHRILLVRSPFFERLLRDQADGSTSTTTSIDLPIDDPTLPGNPITSEALSICFAYLYGAPVFSHIKTGNAHAVLACAHRLELTTLCELCTGFMVKTLAPDTVAACVDFVAGNGSGASLGVYTAQLRQGCLDVLCAQLPAAKPAAVFDTTTADAAAEEQRQILVAAFERLPFAWIKEIIETKLVGPSEFEKFTFAKLLIERRKRVARASVTTGAPTAATNETVVLLFDQDAKGRVSLAEQLVKKPFSRQHSAHAH